MKDEGLELRHLPLQFIHHTRKDGRFLIEPGGSPKTFRLPVCSVSGQVGDEDIHLFPRDFRQSLLPFSLVPTSRRQPFRGVRDLPVSFVVNAFYFDGSTFVILPASFRFSVLYCDPPNWLGLAAIAHTYDGSTFLTRELGLVHPLFQRGSSKSITLPCFEVDDVLLVWLVGWRKFHLVFTLQTEDEKHLRACGLFFNVTMDFLCDGFVMHQTESTDFQVAHVKRGGPSKEQVAD